MFKNALLIIIVMISAGVLISACQPKKVKPTPQIVVKPAVFKKCTDPRPQMCTREYRPVCASKDTGVRCVTTPCPSAENKTYATGCTACADPKVHGYVAGACAK